VVLRFLVGFVRVFGALARARFDGTLFRRRQIDACATGFRQPYGDRLLRRACAVLTAADFFYLPADELSGLGRWRFAFAFVFHCPFHGSFVGHHLLHV
jgi:hypothetical protein